MPQPLRKVLPNCKTYWLDADCLHESRPALAALVASAIGRWALVEQRMAWLLARILGSDAKPALEMFLAIANTVAQADAIKAAARSVLQGDDLLAFEAVMSTLSSQAKNRHRLVHWLWGYTSELEDALILADPVGVIRTVTEQERYDKDPHKWFAETGHDEQALEQMLSGADNTVFVYRRDDLTNTVRDFNEVSDIIFLFGQMISATDQQTRAVLHQQLFKKRLFCEAECRLHAAQKSGSEGPES